MGYNKGNKKPTMIMTKKSNMNVIATNEIIRMIIRNE